MKPVDVTQNMYIDFNKENYKECPKFTVADHVRIWKYKNIFVPNWFEGVSGIKKVKNTVLWTYAISDLNGKETVGTFYKK